MRSQHASVKHPGPREDSYINLYWYGSRWYDPALGRFTSPDSYVPESQGVLAWDRYAYVNNNPVNLTDPTGHFACGDGIDDPRCDQFDTPNIPIVKNYPNDPLTDPDYSTWRDLINGSPCTGCHVTHDGYLDDGLIPNNSKLDSALVAYYRWLDPLAPIVHQGGLNYILFLTTIPTEPFDVAYFEAPRTNGDFPERAQSPYLYRETTAGQTAGFAKYDSSGRVMYRVDLEGPAHGGVTTPHQHQANWNINPRNGAEFFNGWGKTATGFDPISAVFYLIFGR